MAKNIGKLTVDLRLMSQKFEASLKRATTGLTAFRAKTQRITKSMGSMQAGIASLAGVAGFGMLVKNSLKTIDSLAKVSDRLGVATESLSALRFAAEQTGASSETLDMGLQRMTRRIGQVAATGKGEAAPALERLGIAIEDIKRLSPEQQFGIIAQKMQSVATQGEKVFITQKLFDSEGVKLLNTLNLGQDGLQKMIDQAETLGISVNRVEAAKIEAANDAINRSQKAVQGVGNSLAIEMAPVIEAIADNFVEASTKGEGFGETIRGVVERSAGVIGVFADGIHGIKVAIKLVETGLAGFGAAWANIMNFIINDVVAPTAAKIKELLLAPIRSVLEFASGFSDTAASMLEGLEAIARTPGVEALENLADTMSENFANKKDELHDLMMQTIPSESMKEKIAEIYEAAKENGVKVAEKVKESVQKSVTGSSQKEKEAEQAEKLRDKEKQQEKTHLDEMADLQLGNSKKILAIQKAWKLKQAIMAGFVAIQEAWASAPFPANLPAVAVATGTTAANVAGIRGVAHSGIDNVPREGTWLLDKGERVVDSRTNMDLKNFLSGAQTQVQPASQESIVMHFNGPTDRQWFLNNKKYMEEALFGRRGYRR